MLIRHDILNDHWNRIAHRLTVKLGGHGSVGNDPLLFIDAIRYMAKIGIAWAGLSTSYGTTGDLWQRYDRWCRNGVRSTVAAELRDDDTEWLSVGRSRGRRKHATAPAVKQPRRWAAAADSAP